MARGDPVEIEGERSLYFFIHNVYANFFKDTLDYFSLCLYPRFEYRVVATYDKAVEYLTKQGQFEREPDMPLFPALILNPSGDFELADTIAGGKQLWRFPYLAPGFAKYIWDPIYKDANTEVNVGFIRIQGDIELLMLLNSFYEYCDLRMMLLQIFAGFERWIYPRFFSTFIVLPPNLVNYEYSNEYTGLTYKLDWASAGAENMIVRTTAQNELVIPAEIKPLFKLTGFSDNSARYGGMDKLADWRLGATIHYEIEVPSWLILKSDYLVENIDITLKAGSAYSAYDLFDVPVNRTLHTVSYFRPYDETSSSEISIISQGSVYVGGVAEGEELEDIDATCVTTFEGDYVFKTRYFHIVTEAEANSTVDVDIGIPETIDDLKALVVNSKWGELKYGDHYIVFNDGDSLRIKVVNVDLYEGQIIELYIYEKEQIS